MSQGKRTTCKKCGKEMISGDLDDSGKQLCWWCRDCHGSHLS